MESLIWLIAGTQSVAWTIILHFEKVEENHRKESVIRLFRRAVCKSWTEPITGRRFYEIRALTMNDTINALIANSTFAKTTQEDMDAKQ